MSEWKASGVKHQLSHGMTSQFFFGRDCDRRGWVKFSDESNKYCGLFFHFELVWYILAENLNLKKCNNKECIDQASDNKEVFNLHPFS